MARLVASLLLACALSIPAVASACATCGCGDPTLTTLGAGQPFEGRFRLGAQLRYRWDEVGDVGVDRATLHEGRLDLSAAYAPTDWLVLGLTVPLIYRDASWANGGRAQVAGLGEVALDARVVLLRDRAFAPEHLLGVSAGLKMPTGLDQLTPSGQLISVDAQLGSGSWDPTVGLFYTHLADPWALFTSARVTLPFAGRYGETPGASLRASAALQYRFDRHLTIRGGVDVRWDAPAQVGASTDPDTEHVGLFVSPDLLWAPEPDWVLSLGLRVPVFQASAQGRTEGLYVLLSAVVDLETQ